MITLSDRIRTALPFMSEKDRAVLKSMRDNARAYDGRLTDKQMKYVEDILARSTPAQKPVTGLTRILEIFEKAAARLNKPKCHFLVEGEEMTLQAAGATSQNPGYLYVQRKGGQYVGKISPSGVFFGVKTAPADTRSALAIFAEDPMKAALAYGQATGRCARCNKRLTNPVSVEAGMGPICRSFFA